MLNSNQLNIQFNHITEIQKNKSCYSHLHSFTFSLSSQLFILITILKKLTMLPCLSTDVYIFKIGYILYLLRVFYHRERLHTCLQQNRHLISISSLIFENYNINNTYSISCFISYCSTLYPLSSFILK